MSEAVSDTAQSEDGYRSIRLESLHRTQRYKLFMGSVVPRPIALVSTLNAGGKVNVAPFSNFVVVSTSAALLAFSIGSGDDGAREGSDQYDEKDTLRNIRANGEFVINTVPDTLAHQVEACARYHPPDVSEADETGLNLLPSSVIRTPRIAECKVQFECRLHSMPVYGDSHLVIGHVVLMHARDGLVRDFRIDPQEYAPLGRLVGKTYCRLGELIRI